MHKNKTSRKVRERIKGLNGKEKNKIKCKNVTQSQEEFSIVPHRK